MLTNHLCKPTVYTSILIIIINNYLFLNDTWRPASITMLRRRWKYSRVLLDQLCPTRDPPAACGPVEGFVRPNLGCRYSKSILYSDNLSLF